MCLSCILYDNKHFQEHKTSIQEMSEYLTKHMISDAKALECELPKKAVYLKELEGLTSDMDQSLRDIYVEIETDYESFKQRVVNAIDGIRDKLKGKFEDEINSRKNEIDKLAAKIEKVKLLEELEQDKEVEMGKLINEIDNSDKLGTELYFMLYNFLNIDKTHEKALKNVAIEVEEYKKLYKSKKFESYGKLFQEYQKHSKEDNLRLSEMIAEFTSNEKKGSIAKNFKERIDNVFNSEITSNNLYEIKIGNNPPTQIKCSTLYDEAIKENKKDYSLSTLHSKLQPAPISAKSEVEALMATIRELSATENPKLKEILNSPLVLKLVKANPSLMRGLQESAEDAQKSPEIKKSKVEGKRFVDNTPESPEMDIEPPVSLSQRLNIPRPSNFNPMPTFNEYNEDERFHNFQTHLQNLRQRQNLRLTNDENRPARHRIAPPPPLPAKAFDFGQKMQQYEDRSKIALMKEAYTKQKYQVSEHQQYENRQNIQVRRMTIARSVPAEPINFLGKRKGPVSRDPPQFGAPVSPKLLSTPLSKPGSSLGLGCPPSGQHLKKSKPFTSTLLSPISSTTPLVKSLSSLLQTPIAPAPRRTASLPYSYSCSYLAMSSPSLCAEILGQFPPCSSSYLLSGHSPLDTLTFTLLKPSFVKKVLLGPPQLKEDQEFNWKRLEGAVVEWRAQEDAPWHHAGKVLRSHGQHKQHKLQTAEVAIAAFCSEVRVRKDEGAGGKGVSVGVGCFVVVA